MKKFKNNSGVTLIILVVTILVMLIIAGVSIYTAVGEHDKALIKRAKAAEKLIEKDQNADEEFLEDLEESEAKETIGHTGLTMYSIRFYNGEELLAIVKVESGMTALYPDEAPIPTRESTETESYVFNGKWATDSTETTQANLTNITSSTRVYAMFDVY